MILPRKLPGKLPRKLRQELRQKLLKTGELILDAIKKSPSLTNKELAAICGITTDGVYYQLKQLKASGKIRRVGPDKGGHWEVIKQTAESCFRD